MIERVSERSLKASQLARKIAEYERLPAFVVNTATYASLLAHIGTVVLAASLSKEFQEISVMADSGNLTIDKVEQRIIHADHAMIGAFLLGLWGFNDNLVEAVAYHHRPGASGSHSLDALTIVHVTQCLARAETRLDYVDHLLPREIDHTYLAEVGAISRLPDWIAIFRSVRRSW